MITVISLCLAVPLGFVIGVFLSEIAPAAVKSILQPCLDLLVGIPSVVYGFFGYMTILPWLEKRFDMATGECILAAGLILSIMVLPFIASFSAEAFQSVPSEMKEAAMSQGVTRFYTIHTIIVPHAASGMFAAVSLGFARAIGETLAVLMLAGNSVAIPTSILNRGQPLTALIATEVGETGVGSAKYHALFGAGLVLLLVVFLINMGVWALKGRFLHNEK